MRDYVNLLDIAELPSTQRKIMRLILRKVEMTYSELSTAVDNFPEADRMSREELEQILESLNQSGWVTKTEKNKHLVYKANLRRQPAVSKETRKPDRNIWDVLSMSDDTSPSKKPDFRDL